MKNDLLNLWHISPNDKLELAENLLSGGDEERKQIAREVHDGLKYDVLRLQEYINFLEIDNFSLENKNTLLALVRRILATSQGIAYNLQPKMLDAHDLATCLKLEFIDRNALLPHVNINVDYIQVLNVILPKAAKLNLLRIAQQAVQNAISHSEATEIVVQLRKTDNNLLILSIHDNGNGFDIENIDVKKSHGLKNLVVRAETIGAKPRIFSEIGNGTIIVVEYPLDSSSQNQ